MDNIVLDETSIANAATEYLDMVNKGIDASHSLTGGQNPLMELTGKDNCSKDEVDLEGILADFDMHAPLTEQEKAIIERGVNDEAIDKLRELVKDAEIAGEVEKMDYLQKTLDAVEKCRAKGLLNHYIEIDKDSGEIVRGKPAMNNMPEPPPPPPMPNADNEDGDGESSEEAGGNISGDAPEEDASESAQNTITDASSDNANKQPSEASTEPPAQPAAPSATPPQDAPVASPGTDLPVQQPEDEKNQDDAEGQPTGDSIDPDLVRRLGGWYGC